MSDNTQSTESTEERQPTTYINSKNISEGVIVKGRFNKRFQGGKYNSITYFFEDEEIGPVGVNKLGNLEFLMENNKKTGPIAEGDIVEVSYDGFLPSKRNPDQSFHTFQVKKVG